MNSEKRNSAVLVVEDNRDSSRMLSFLLKSLGYKNVLFARDGEEAFLTLKQPHDIICIISDWNMPNMSGFDLLLNLRASFPSNSRINSIPFLMMTSEGQKDKVVEAMSAGVTDYILKPYTSAILEDKLKSILKVDNDQR